MKRLSGCPGVIHLLDVYEEPDKPCTHLVMELVTGGELFDYIVKCSSYSEKSASDYVRQLCQTVEYLHSKNIVHRDLKPENMLFEDPSAQVLKLCDFGLADTLKDEFDFLTLAVGTKSYMAPEVSSNMGYGKPVDMYSIGVILYILLCGYLPIDPDNGIYVLEFPPSEWSGISFEVKLLIKKLLDDSPAARPTATQVLKHPWVRGTNTSTKPLIGTLRNLKSWNQTGGRAVTKPRGQVMNLFDNPPPVAPTTGNNATASSSTDTGPPAHPKGPRSPNKPKVTKAKKAPLPKVVNGVLTLPSDPQPPPKPAATLSVSSPVSTPPKKTKKPADQPIATFASPKATAAVVPRSTTPNEVESPPSKPSKSSEGKPTKRKGDKYLGTESTSKPKATDIAANSPLNASVPPATDHSNNASVAPTTSSPTSSAPSRHNGESKAQSAAISERTKMFLQEQDARAAKKQVEAKEKKDRRKSLGTPSRKNDKVDKSDPNAATAAAAPEKSEKKKDKKDKSATKTDREMASSAVPTSPLGSYDFEDEKKYSKVSKRRSMKDIGADLDVMIALAMTDDEGFPETRERSSTTAGIIVSPPSKRKSRRVPDLVGGGIKDTAFGSEPSSRSTPSTPTGDFSSFGSDSLQSNRGSSKASSTATITVTNRISPSSSFSGLKSGTAPTLTNPEEYYPKRSSSKQNVAVTKKTHRMSAGSPSKGSNKQEALQAHSTSSSPASTPVDTPTKRREKASSSGRGSAHRPTKSATTSSNPGSSSSPTTTSSPSVKQSSRNITISKPPKIKKSPQRSESESSSSGGSSIPSSPTEDNAKIQLEHSSPSDEDVIVIKKKKKKPVLKKIHSQTSSSSSTSRSY